MQIEHECPQCGAPVQLTETDTLLSCSFCKTRLFMQAADHFRYCIPPHDPLRENTFYVPYWRFRGIRFLCKTSGVESGLVDKTFAAVKNSGLPSSLGIRPQSLKLTFAEPGNGASYLKPALAFDRSSAVSGNSVEYQLVRTQGSSIVRISDDDYDIVPDIKLEIKEERIYHEALISDTLSLIYAPFYTRNEKVHDGVTGDVVAGAAAAIFDAEMEENGWKVNFLPTICPNCGWDTVSGRDSCIAFCKNCSRAWQVTQQGLSPAAFFRMPPALPDDRPHVYLPFWRISGGMTGVKLDTYADFMKLTNLPRAPQTAWETRPFYFWFPAFKTAPALFLRCSRHLTISDPENIDDTMPHAPIVPVNLSSRDAFATAGVLIADLTLRKKTFFPLLQNITTEIREASLVFIPFSENSNELVQPDMNFSLFKNALKFGQNI